MKAYAGIGSRDITIEERIKIAEVAEKLANFDYICYSGNASGADNAFQLNSKGKCVLYLPWDNFNFNVFRPIINDNCLEYLTVGDCLEGVESVDEFHPNPDTLSQGVVKLMARNYYQIYGIENRFPKVELVVCCADQDNLGNVLGGTGQAVRIAKHEGISIVNIRTKHWEDELHCILNPIW